MVDVTTASRHRQHIEVAIHHFDVKAVFFNRGNDSIELASSVSSLIADDRQPEYRRLPRLLLLDFRHGDVEPPPHPLNAKSALEKTQRFWTAWTKKCRPAGHCSDAVTRSLITLKALTFWSTGGIVAAPTTSLPEQLGSVRNWDYRFCWLRDATLTLLALMNAGYSDEAQAWREWLLRAVAGSPEQLQIMYGIAG